MGKIVPGLYRHYKGGVYTVQSTAVQTETGEELVIYVTMDGTVCARPRTMFEDMVEVDGKSVPRFSFIEEQDDLSVRMQAAGMRSIQDILENPVVGKLGINAHVVDLDSYEAWLKDQTEYYLRMQVGKTLDKEDTDQLFEWVLAHSAVYGTVYHTFLAAIGRGPKE